MKAVLDSGAEMSVVPAHVVPPSAYTGDKLKAAGVWGEGSLPLAKLTIGAEKGSSTMLVLVRRGTQEVLLGQDFPYFADLMHVPFQPLDCLDLHLTKHLRKGYMNGVSQPHRRRLQTLHQC
jgi:hypothetical protein